MRTNVRGLIGLDTRLVPDFVGNACRFEGFDGHLHREQLCYGSIGPDTDLGSFLWTQRALECRFARCHSTREIT